MNECEKEIQQKLDEYIKRYCKYAFRPWDATLKYIEQYEGAILRLTHIVEKGLSYSDYRFGSGRDAIKQLIEILRAYSDNYDITMDFYETGLSACKQYIEKNKNEIDISDIIANYELLPGNSNSEAGTVSQYKSKKTSQNFEDILNERHSVRHFSSDPVDIDLVKRAIIMSQNTPSACNRQGWRARIIADDKVKHRVLENQNGGTKGFGDEIDKLIIITCDLRYTNIDRELFQAFIEGGMYLANILNSLQFMGVASIPLTGSLHMGQIEAIRKLIGMDNAEILIAFVGVGNYADEYKVTKSRRKNPYIEII